MENLAIINGEVAMAYQGEMPWHKLGNPNIGKTVPEAIKSANLDWLLTLEPLFCQMGVRADAKDSSSRGLVEVPNRKAVVRDIDGEILGVVGNDYQIFQNHEAFGVLTPAIKKFGVTIESAGALGRGERVWMLAKLPESIEPIKDDKIDGYFLISTGHNGGIPFAARPTPVRVVCENTLTAAEYGTSAWIKLHHTKSDSGQFDLVEKLITEVIHVMQLSGDTFAELAKKNWDMVQVREYINAVLQLTPASESGSDIAAFLGADISSVSSAKEKQRDQILSLVWNGKGAAIAGANKKKQSATAWAAYNAVTEWVDHVRPAEASEKMQRQANQSALFGSANLMKERALELAIAA